MNGRAPYSLGFYLVAVHLAVAALALPLGRLHLGYIAAVELVLLGSGMVGLRIWRQINRTSERLRIGVKLLEEGDLTSRLAERDIDPELGRLVAAVRAQAEKLSAERVRLGERAHFLDKVLAASPAGMVTLGFDGEISDVNPAAARLLDRAPEALLGLPVGAALGPLAEKVGALGAGQSAIVSLPLRAAHRRARVHKGEFIDRGFARQFLLIEELTEELRQTERAAYEKVIRLMSHELNNSMGAAGSLLESCLRYAPQIGEGERGDFENALTVVMNRIRQLSGFVASYAALVRLPTPRKTATALQPLLTGVATLLRADSERRRVLWRMELDPATPMVAIDAAQIEQAVVNIAKNALEAIGQDGTITVRLGARASGGAELTIEDTGKGLSATARTNLFAPFFSTKERGQGLGLTLVQEILVQHGCAFALDGPEGGPTRFSIGFS